MRNSPSSFLVAADNFPDLMARPSYLESARQGANPSQTTVLTSPKWPTAAPPNGLVLLRR